MSEPAYERQILGVNFYVGSTQGAIEKIARGGLVVVPSAPTLKDIASIDGYRDALLNADMAITDSALMVLVWNFLEDDSIPRLSGFEYLRALLQQDEVRAAGNTFWVMAGKVSLEKNIAWLKSVGIEVPVECIYQAPMYGDRIEDVELTSRLQSLRPKHVIITVGGGTQERLGIYLKRNLDYLPSIHCIGAAIAFLSGDQIRIPVWADRLYLGWLLRCFSSPRRYVPRYLSGARLIPLLWRYRDQLPVARNSHQPLTQAE